MHYYLTLYLALRTGCFSQGQAIAIANGDQLTDELDTYSPGLGKVYENSTYHALNSKSRPGVSSDALAWQASIIRNDYLAFGRFLHYYQDTFSHAGYPDSYIGHLRGGHRVDKTATDTSKAMDMARGSYQRILEFANSSCGCKGKPWDSAMDTAVSYFNGVDTRHPGAADIEGDTGIPLVKLSQLADPAALDEKIRFLGVPRR